MLFGHVKLDTPLTIEDVNYYNLLEERDIAREVKIRKVEFKREDGSEFTPDEICPNCGHAVNYGSENFCQYCGQRLKRCKDGDDTQRKSEADK